MPQNRAVNSSLIIFVNILDNEDNKELYAVANSIADHVKSVQDYCECEDMDSHAYCVVSKDFDSDFFMKIRNSVRAILSPKMFLDYSKNHMSLPIVKRPTYNEKLKDVVVSLSCVCSSPLLGKYVTLLHNMSAMVKKSPTEGTNLVVTNRSDLPEAIQGSAMEIPVISESWITKCWSHRDEDDFDPLNPIFIASHLIKCFYGLYIAFFGFSEEEYFCCAQLVIDGDGSCVDITDQRCTHIIVSDDSNTLPPKMPKNEISVVTSQWFWRCIQLNMYVHVNSYLYDYNALSSKKNLLAFPEDRPHLISERSSDTSAEEVESKAKSSPHSSTLQQGSVKSTDIKQQARTRRQCIFDEIYTTERNFCNILEFIGKFIRDELLHMLGNPSRELISLININLIFGSISQVYDVHRQILAELTKISTNWSEKCEVGRIYHEQLHILTNVHQRFTNNYRECIQRIKTLSFENPRFLAFLKLKESVDICGRQKLVELYIKPVQRIPQTVLLLQELLKYTPEKVADHGSLMEVIPKLKESLSKINEFCRETDNYVLMLDLMNEISKCPATLRSSSRKLLMKIRAVELSNLLVKEGDEMVMCVFNDCLELCKVRKKSAISTNKLNKKLKHIALFPLSSIRRIISVTDDDRTFALVWRSINCMSDLICAFTLIRDEMSFSTDRDKVIAALARHVNDASCSSDTMLILSCNLESLPENVIQSKMTRLTNTISRMFSFKLSESPRPKMSVQMVPIETTQNTMIKDDFDNSSLYSYDSTVIKRLSRKGSISNSMFSISSETGPDRRRSKRSSIFGRMRSKRTI